MVWQVSPAASNETGASHAHPKSSSHATLQDLVTEIDIRVELNGLSGSHHYKAADVYFPEVRRPATTESTINHLDVISCWKGLSLAQASEILYWESNFKKSLEHTVTHSILEIFRHHIRYGNECADDVSSVNTLLSTFVQKYSTRVIDVSIPGLVTYMIQRFFEENPRNIGRHTWFTSTRDMTSMVFNFVRTRDCFIEGCRFPSVKVHLTYEPTRLGLISANVDWVSPRINMTGLPSRLQEHAEYHISPYYLAPVLSEYFCSYPVKASYSAHTTHGRHQLPLLWNAANSTFSTITPRYQAHAQDFTAFVNTIMSVNIEQPFPDGVRFEQTTRYRIRLEVEQSQSDENTRVTPCESPWQPSFSNTPLSKRAQPSTPRGVSASPSSHGLHRTNKASVDRRLLERLHTRLSSLELQHARLLSYANAIEQISEHHGRSSSSYSSPSTKSDSPGQLGHDADVATNQTHKSIRLDKQPSRPFRSRAMFEQLPDQNLTRAGRWAKLDHHPQKRKASEQLPGGTPSEPPSAQQPLVPHQIGDSASPQTIKRQKLIDRTDDEVESPQEMIPAECSWDSAALEYITTYNLNEAVQAVRVPRAIASAWYDESSADDQQFAGRSDTSRSRGHEARDSKVNSPPSENGNVERMVFPQQRKPYTHTTPSPESGLELPLPEASPCYDGDVLPRVDSAQTSPQRTGTPPGEKCWGMLGEHAIAEQTESRVDAQMRQYQENYAGFLREKSAYTMSCIGAMRDEEMEKVFLLDSGDHTDCS